MSLTSGLKLSITRNSTIAKTPTIRGPNTLNKPPSPSLEVSNVLLSMIQEMIIDKSNSKSEASLDNPILLKEWSFKSCSQRDGLLQGWPTERVAPLTSGP